MNWDIFVEILIMLGAALLAGTIAEQLRQSAILGYLVAGTLVGPNVLGFVGQGEHVRAIAELGVALLLFTIGLEFSFRRLRRLGRIALVGGSLQVLVTMAIAGMICLIFGIGVRASIAIGAMIALSSTACVLRLLVDRSAVDSMYGRNALGILLMQDVAVIPLMLVVVLLSGGGTLGEASMMLGRTLLYAVLLVGGFVILFNYVVPRFLNIERWAKNRELPVLLAIVIALGSAYAAHAASLSPAIGAFIAGVLLGESPFATQIRADVATLRTLLVTLFFASIGMLGDPAWAIGNLHLVAMTVALIMIGKWLIVWGIVRSIGFTHGISAATGICLAQVGEFSFVLAQTAHHPVALISDHLFNLIITATIVTLFLTPYFVAGAPAINLRIESLLPGRRKGRFDEPQADDEESSRVARIIIIGFGPAGQAIAEALYRRHRRDIVVIELNHRTADAARRLGLRVLIGDAAQREVLDHAGISRARVIAVTVPDPVTSRTIIHICREIATQASIVVRSRYHNRRWELEFAGARDVIDEELNVGMRMAALVRRYAQAEKEPPSSQSER